MSADEFFCYGCQRWRKVAARKLRPSGKPICEKCSQKAFLNANQDTIVKKFPEGHITRAAQLAGKHKANAKRYKKTNQYYPE